MLKITAIALAMLIIPAPATAGEINEKCGTELTWRGVKCAWQFGSVTANEERAQKYERYAKYADIDGDANRAQKWRNRAAFAKAEAARLRAEHDRKYPKKQ